MRSKNFLIIMSDKRNPKVLHCNWHPIKLKGASAKMTDLDKDPAQAEPISAFERALRQMLDRKAVDGSAEASQRALVEKHGGRAATLKKWFWRKPGARQKPI